MKVFVLSHNISQERDIDGTSMRVSFCLKLDFNRFSPGLSSTADALSAL